MDLSTQLSLLPSVVDNSFDLLIEQTLSAFNHLSLFILLVTVLFLLQRLVFKTSMQLFGGKAIYISAWIGTPIHELSHAFACIVFGHKIKRILLFSPDQKGTLGYVTHSYNNRNLWQVMGNFFIAIAPLLGGLFALYLVTWLCLDNAIALFNLLQNGLVNGLSELQTGSLLNLTHDLASIIQQAYIDDPLKLGIWVYCCAAISLHLSPSAEDIKGISGGLFTFVVVCILLMLINQYLQLTWFSEVGAMINTVSMAYLIGIVLASILLLPLLFTRCLLLVMSIK